MNSAPPDLQLLTQSAARAGLMHACEIKTSYMLALAPEYLSMDAAQANYPPFPETFDVLPERWDSFSGSPVMGDPRAAGADKGETILAAVVSRLVALTTAALAATPK